MQDQTIDILSHSIAKSLKKAIDLNGYASLVVCGGRSPLSLYKDLSGRNLDWTKVLIFMGDDRIINKDHKDSNENLIREHLLINNAASAQFRSLLHPKISIESIRLPFDVVLLGLGRDGHFASLFPDQLNHKTAFKLNAAPDFIISKKPLGSPSYKRISMNLSMLINTKRCILLVTNKDKRMIVDQAYTDNGLPLHFLLSQDKTLVECSDLYF